MIFIYREFGGHSRRRQTQFGWANEICPNSFHLPEYDQLS